MQQRKGFPRHALAALLATVLPLAAFAAGRIDLAASSGGYPVVDTGQSRCYDDRGEIACPRPGEPFYGQDAQHSGVRPTGNPARYFDRGDGTVTDLVTGLMWQQTPAYHLTFDQAVAAAGSVRTGGYDDWRLPSIKELYSLIDFDGVTGRTAGTSVPYLYTRVFDFEYGDESSGERFIDAQYCSSTRYVGTTMGGNATVFGVNFADGRIKGYPIRTPDGREKAFDVRYVRGNPAYGVNDFTDNGDGTITDRATGLMWSRADSGEGMNWEEALAWVGQRNAEGYLGYDDWRLPDAKELQSIVDYARAPDVTGSAAIDPLFEVSEIGTDEYPYFWTSTTHLEGPADVRGSHAVYIAFGRAQGYMRIPPWSRRLRLLDVHGAGAQRSDPKSGDPGRWPNGRGPQGDVIRIFNYVRLVRG